jgi:hypothetical protein
MCCAGADDEDDKLIVPFAACVESYFGDSEIHEFRNPSLGPDAGLGRALQTVRLATFPPYLIVKVIAAHADMRLGALSSVIDLCARSVCPLTALLCPFALVSSAAHVARVLCVCVYVSLCADGAVPAGGELVPGA